jgi:NADPH:quinone reductase-like Zn-dependent oxidoreductase
MAQTMKVVRFYPPGGPEKLKYEAEPVPSPPGKKQVLIKVHGVGLIWPELYWPIYQSPAGDYISHIPGHDFSGVVTAIGPECEGSGLEVGSEVYGLTSRRNHEGAMAEFVKADIDQVVLKPRNLSFVEAAAVPLSALTAWQALFDHGKLEKGQRVLVTGGAGGTGVFAVQFAKMFGAYVVATGSSARSREILEGNGLDKFIDYKATDLKSTVKDIDLVLECVGEPVLEQCFDVVKKEGTIISITSLHFQEEASKRGVNGKFFIVRMNAEQLNNITKMVEDGTIKPIVDATYPLEETGKAFEEASAGHVHGKVVIKVV